MPESAGLVDALFDHATAVLHDALSELAEATKAPLSVRRQTEHRTAVIVDVSGHHTLPINRFHLQYRKEVVGNRDVDGVNATTRRWPTTLTAGAGNLHNHQLLVTFEDSDPLEVYEWMLGVIARSGALRI